MWVGCLNGGGQIRVDPKANKQLLTTLNATYHARPLREPGHSPLVTALYKEWLGGATVGSAAAQKVLHTSYHAIQSLEELNPLLSKW